MFVVGGGGVPCFKAPTFAVRLCLQHKGLGFLHLLQGIPNSWTRLKEQPTHFRLSPLFWASLQVGGLEDLPGTAGFPFGTPPPKVAGAIGRDLRTDPYKPFNSWFPNGSFHFTFPSPIAPIASPAAVGFGLGPWGSRPRTFAKNAKGPLQRSVIIMDECDGMAGGDKGGIQADADGRKGGGSTVDGAKSVSLSEFLDFSSHFLGLDRFRCK